MKSTKLTKLATGLTLLIAGFASASENLADLAGEQWYGIYMNGEKIGYLQNAMSVDESGRVTIFQDATFKLNMVGMKQDMHTTSHREYDGEGALRSIETEVIDISGENAFNAEIRNGTMYLVSQVGGQRSMTELPDPGETLDDAMAVYYLVSDSPTLGKSVTFSMFEPMYQKALESTSTVIGVEEQLFDGVPTQVYQLQTDIPMLGLRSVSHVTEAGLTLEDSFAGMLTMRLEPESVAKDVQYQNDVIVSNAATVDQRIPEPRRRETLTLNVYGPLEDQHLFTDMRQTLRADGDRFYFEGRRLLQEDVVSLELPIEDESVAQWLAPSTFVQSDNPRITETAREIIGDETDALRAVDLLSSWVYENVHATFSARLTNSLEVLNNMEGDCTEHSMLFIGLARAAGIPAREVAGLIYVDDPEPGFYFHQWATVWVGTWIDVDPTFDQTIADATHIKLSEGDLFEQAKLLPIIGNVRVDVIE